MSNRKMLVGALSALLVVGATVTVVVSTSSVAVASTATITITNCSAPGQSTVAIVDRRASGDTFSWGAQALGIPAKSVANVAPGGSAILTVGTEVTANISGSVDWTYTDPDLGLVGGRDTFSGDGTASHNGPFYWYVVLVTGTGCGPEPSPSPSPSEPVPLITVVSSVSSDGCELTASDWSETSVVTTTAPAGVSVPYGLLDVTATCTDPGGSITMTLGFPGPVTELWKYNTDLAAWSKVTNASFSGNTATYILTDGGINDDDGVANSVILDPIGGGVRAGFTG
jgi:hypothetical protein